MSNFNFVNPTTTTNAGFGFAPSPALGTTTSNTATPPKLSFGLPANPTAPTGGFPIPSSGLTFGQTPAPTVAPASITFGAPQTGLSGFSLPTSTTPTVSAPLTFGAPPAFGSLVTKPVPTTTAPPLYSFGTMTPSPVPTTAPPAFGLGGTTLTPTTAQVTLNFSAPMATTTAGTVPSLNFGSSGGGISFGAAVTTSAPPAFPSFGTATTTAPLTGGMFGSLPLSEPNPCNSNSVTSNPNPKTTAPTLPAPPSFGLPSTAPFGTSTSVTTAPPKLGLGGIDMNATQPKTTEGRPESGRAKDNQVPKEILNTVDSLKTHIKEQKAISDDIARTSNRKLNTVSSEIQNCNWSLAEISNNLKNNYATIKQLRSETSDAIQHAEMAQRTQETPAGLQFENTAPLHHFMSLVHRYESDMIMFRKQVEMTEQHINSLTNPQSFTADELKMGLKQMHESFIALAGRLHETHQKVEQQKEQYLHLRANLLKDNTNVFEQIDAQSKGVAGMSKISSGPTPFSTLGGFNYGMQPGNSWSSNTTQQQPATAQPTGQNSMNFGTVGGGQSTLFGSSTSGFGSGGFGAPTNFSTGDGNFNLQKPPVGSKRNKH